MIRTITGTDLKCIFIDCLNKHRDKFFNKASVLEQKLKSLDVAHISVKGQEYLEYGHIAFDCEVLRSELTKKTISVDFQQAKEQIYKEIDKLIKFHFKAFKIYKNKITQDLTVKNTRPTWHTRSYVDVISRNLIAAIEYKELKAIFTQIVRGIENGKIKRNQS